MGIYDQLDTNMITKLSDKKVQALKPQTKAYRVNDDNGLSCLITPSGKKFWRIRYMWLGREKMLSMGEYPHTSLELAGPALHRDVRQIGLRGPTSEWLRSGPRRGHSYFSDVSSTSRAIVLYVLKVA